MAEVRERNIDWLHHLSSTIPNGHEPNHQRRQEEKPDYQRQPQGYTYHPTEGSWMTRHSIR